MDTFSGRFKKHRGAELFPFCDLGFKAVQPDWQADAKKTEKK